MVNTYTSSFQFVNNGDTTTENPASLVGEPNILVSNAEIQWEGSTTTGSSTTYSTNTNTGSANAYTTEETVSKENGNGDFYSSPPSENTLPPVPNGYDFALHSAFARVTASNLDLQDGETVEVKITISMPNGDLNEQTELISNSLDAINTAAQYSKNVGASVSVDASFVDNSVNGSLQVRLDTTTKGNKSVTKTKSDTTSVSYPSVPNGYSFNRHYYREEKNGSYVDSDYSYSNKVGQSRSVTSNDTSVTRSLEMETRGEQTNTYTNYTNNPSVSGDVSASSSASLDDNETSSWQSLSGFGLGDNSLSHSIGDSGEGYYRIRFDWELAYPTEVATFRGQDTSGTIGTRLADMDDGALAYNTVRTYVPSHGYAAFDVVSPNNDEASDITIEHPTHGTLALRAK